MPLLGTVGKTVTYKQKREIQVEWKVEDIFSLSEVVGDNYDSPHFNFAGRAWYLHIYPNGEKKHNSEGWIGIYIFLRESSSPLDVQHIVGMKTAKGIVIPRWSHTKTFQWKDKGYGCPKFLERSDLSRRRDELIDSDALTIAVALKTNISPLTESTSSQRLKDNVCLNLKNMLSTGKKSDVVFKLGDREFRAHRLILESRSSVFEAMFNLEIQEKNTGVVKIADIDPDVFELVLSYLYSGHVGEISSDKICQVFVAADKYDLKDLKEWCVFFMQDNLSVDTVCDVLSLANRYSQKELKQQAKEFFVKNSVQILDTDEWEEFSSQNQAIAIQILASIVKDKGK